MMTEVEEIELTELGNAKDGEASEACTSAGTDTANTALESTNNEPLCNLYDGNREALGWALDAVPRAVIVVGPAIFLSTAILRLAKEAAGCEIEVPEGETIVPECHNRVYGLKPSSFLTVYTMVVGVASASLMPLFGSIMDHTQYRRAMGRISALLMTILTFCQIFISDKTWFPIAILQFFVGFFYYVHSLVSYAYLPEITDDKQKLIKYTANFSIVQYLSMVAFLVFTVVTTTVTGIADDDLKTAIFSQIVTFIIAVIFFGYSWTFLFPSRPATQTIPEGKTLLNAGFINLFNTTKKVCSQNKPLMYFLISLAFSSSAIISLSTIAITYMTDKLLFTATENGIAILTLLLASIPGSLISGIVTRKINPIRSLQLCLFLACLNTVIATVILTGPNQQFRAYVISAGWGVATGWKYPAERFLYCTIIPKHQYAEFMGMYIFAEQSISWLPPLVFTAMNESGIDMRIGVGILGVFFLLSCFILFLVGNYDAVMGEMANLSTEEEHQWQQDGNDGGTECSNEEDV